MKNLSYIVFNKTLHRELLAEFLISQQWPFHVYSQLNLESTLELIDKGNFNNSENETHLIFNNSNVLLGFIRLLEMDDIEEGDGSPLFDIRISNQYQGHGVGSQAVQWLTNYLFNNYPLLNRIEATTRADNFSMRSVLKKCYFLKEGHYRASWPDENNKLIDTVRYGILRDDWNNKSVTQLEWNDF